MYIFYCFLHSPLNNGKILSHKQMTKSFDDNTLEECLLNFCVLREKEKKRKKRKKK